MKGIVFAVICTKIVSRVHVENRAGILLWPVLYKYSHNKMMVASVTLLSSQLVLFLLRFKAATARCEENSTSDRLLPKISDELPTI